MNDIVTPVPNREPSASSVQRYTHGEAEHWEDEPSKETGDPVTGFNGLYVKAGTEFAAGFTVIVTSEVLDSSLSDAVRRST